MRSELLVALDILVTTWREVNEIKKWRKENLWMIEISFCNAFHMIWYGTDHNEELLLFRCQYQSQLIRQARREIIDCKVKRMYINVTITYFVHEDSFESFVYQLTRKFAIHIYYRLQSSNWCIYCIVYDVCRNGRRRPFQSKSSTLAYRRKLSRLAASDIYFITSISSHRNAGALTFSREHKSTHPDQF